MSAFAHTNLQLLKQMRDHGFSQPDVAHLAQAYHKAVPLFSCQYRHCGKPFITHLVSTASILTSKPSSAALIAAGLFHAAYTAGDFGFHYGRRRSAKQRQHLQTLIGHEAESIVNLYDTWNWQPADITQRLKNAANFSALELSTVQLYLANTLEDFSDGGMAFNFDQKAAAFADTVFQQNILALANECGWPLLQHQLSAAFNEFNQATTGATPRNSLGISTRQLPPAATLRILPVLSGGIARRLRRRTLL